MLLLAILAALATGLGGFGCTSEPPTAPHAPPPPPGGPPPAGTPSVVNIEIIVPPIAPGQTVQLSVKAVRSDGSNETVAEGVRWSNPFSNVLQVTTAGLATGRSAGEAPLFASFGGRSASANVLVLPANTFRLSGFVRDFGFGVPDVTVSVISGTGSGLTTRTASDGSYRLFGVAGSLELQIKKEGYGNARATLDVAEHRAHDLSIVLVGTRGAYAGAYTLTIRAEGPCVVDSELRERRYDAGLVQEGGRVTLSLTGGQFIMNGGRGNGFSGYLDGSGNFRFPISDAVVVTDWYYYYDTYTGSFDIAERVGNRSLLVDGTAFASDADGRITGRLDGYLRTTARALPPFLPFDRNCYSNKHVFELVPKHFFEVRR
jgi:hypothetical protein